MNLVPHTAISGDIDSLWLDRIRESVGSMNYGSIHIKIHDGKVVEIETSRKFRFSQPASTHRPHHFPTTPVEDSHKSEKPVPAVLTADRTKATKT